MSEAGRSAASYLDGQLVRGPRGWGLRVALGVCAAVAAAMSMIESPAIGPTSVVGIALMLLVIGAATAPGSVLPFLLLIALVLYRLAASGPLIDPTLGALIVLVPLIHQLAGIAAAIPPRSLVSWRALRPSALRLAVAVLLVECAVLAAALL